MKSQRQFQSIVLATDPLSHYDISVSFSSQCTHIPTSLKHKDTLFPRSSSDLGKQKRKLPLIPIITQENLVKDRSLSVAFGQKQKKLLALKKDLMKAENYQLEAVEISRIQNDLAKSLDRNKTECNKNEEINLSITKPNYLSSFSQKSSLDVQFSPSITPFQSYTINYDTLGPVNTQSLIDITANQKQINEQIEGFIDKYQLKQFLQAQQERQEKWAILSDSFILPELKRLLQYFSSPAANKFLDIYKLVYQEQLATVLHYEKMVRKQYARQTKFMLDQEADQNENEKIQKMISNAWSTLLLMYSRYDTTDDFEKNIEVFNESYQCHKHNISLIINNRFQPEFDIMNNVESLLDELKSKIYLLNIQISDLEKKIIDIQSFLKKSIVISEQETETLLKKYQTEIEKAPPVVDTITNLQKIELIYRDFIKNYQQKNESLEQQLHTAKHQILKFNNQINSQQIEQIPPAPKFDKEIQVNIAVPLRRPPFYNPQLCPFTSSPFRFSLSCLHSFTSVILTNKFIWDYENYMQDPKNKQMYTQPLRVYLLEWFYEQFGNQSFGMMMLQEFVTAAKQQYNSDKRIAVFLEMAGIRNKEFSQFEPEERFIASFEVYSIYIKIGLLYHYTSLEIINTYSPLLPSGGKPAILSQEFCLEVAQFIILESGLPIDIYYNYSFLFQNLLKQDLIDQCKQNQGEITAGVQRKGVRFDVFVSSLIDVITEERCKRIKKLSNLLKLTMHARKTQDFFFQRFQESIEIIYGKQTHNWVVARYTEFLSSTEHSVTARLNQIFEHFLQQQYPNDGQFYINFQVLSQFQFNHYTIPNKRGRECHPSVILPFNYERPPKEITVILFDCINWIMLFEELYVSVRPLLKATEKYSDQVALAHQALLKDIERFPRGAEISVWFINKLNSEVKKEDLIRKIKSVGKQFVEVIDFTLSKCQDQNVTEQQ